MQGTRLGTYILEDKIGEGGMGVVYTATDTRLKRKAVIKMLHKHLAEHKEIAKRFQNEAIAAAGIGHPGIVEIYDTGYADDGSLYIVMELLRGQSLQSRIDQKKPVEVERALAIIRQCASALSAAHGSGIIHRDLKPDNIFLEQDSAVIGGERAKLLDFGIAKLAGTNAASLLTAAGTAMGTAYYMSPEQCKDAGGVDHRTDLYALGCILFQMLTGRFPFVGTSNNQLIIAHVVEPPPTVRSLNPNISPELEQLVSILLAKDPDDRFATADALIAALDGLRAGHAGQPRSKETIRGGHEVKKFPAVPPARIASAPPRAVENDSEVAPERAALPSTRIATAPPQVVGSKSTAMPKRVAVQGASIAGTPPGEAPHVAPITTFGMSAGEGISLDFPANSRSKLGLILAAFSVLLVGVVGLLLLGGDDKGSESSADDLGSADLIVQPDKLDEASPDPDEIEKNFRIQLSRLATEIEEGRGQQSLNSLERLQSLWPRDAQVNYLLGLVYSEEGAFLRAETRFRDATRLKPLGDYFFHLSLTLVELGKFQEALGECERVNSGNADSDLLRSAEALCKEVRAKVPGDEERDDCDEVACLVDPGQACCRKFITSSSSSSSNSNLPEKLSRADISAGVAKIKGRITSCGDETGGQGTVKVKIKIGGNGRVSVAQASGGSSSLRSCVTSAVKRAKFPMTQRGMTVTYPFVFR